MNFRIEVQQVMTADTDKKKEQNIRAERRRKRVKLDGNLLVTVEVPKEHRQTIIKISKALCRRDSIENIAPRLNADKIAGIQSELDTEAASIISDAARLLEKSTPEIRERLKRWIECKLPLMMAQRN